MQYTADNILVRPAAYENDPDLILSITPEGAGWEYISFLARRLAADQSWSFESGENELVIVTRWLEPSKMGEFLKMVLGAVK